MKVLVVEDNVSLLESIRQILTDEYEVDTADNGEDGLFMAQSGTMKLRFFLRSS